MDVQIRTRTRVCVCVKLRTHQLESVKGDKDTKSKQPTNQKAGRKVVYTETEIFVDENE